MVHRRILPFVQVEIYKSTQANRLELAILPIRTRRYWQKKVGNLREKDISTKPTFF